MASQVLVERIKTYKTIPLEIFPIGSGESLSGFEQVE
jgi:hypothetical protein